MPAYKSDKTGTWFCKFYYKDWQGARRQKMKKGFQTKREAQEFERSFLNKAHASCDMTFGNLIEIYMEDCKPRLKPTTYTNKRFLIDTKILPFFQAMPINTINAAAIRRWQNELMEDSHKYSPTYLKTMNNQLSAIFNFAVKYYQLSNNPCRLAGSMGKKNADSMQFWTVEEFSQFIEAISDKPAAKVIFEILFWTGIRSGEMLALTLDDFDLEANTVSISKNYARHYGQDLIMPPKTPKSKRVITLPPFLTQLVQEYADSIKGYQSDQRLFPFTKYFLHHEMQRGCAEAHVKKIRVHDLRHSHASLLIEMGFSPLLISERLGHENIETTLQIYSHLYPNKHSEVANQLEALNTRNMHEQVPLVAVNY